MRQRNADGKKKWTYPILMALALVSCSNDREEPRAVASRDNPIVETAPDLC